MVLSEFGNFWLWFLIVANFGLVIADKRFRFNLWELFRTLWHMVSYQKEAEPVDETAKGVLSRLLRSGFRNASAHFSPKYDKRRIEFRKYIRDPGDYGIELLFWNDKWASAYFQNVSSYCEAQRLPYRIIPKGTGNSPETICVDFSQDVEAAANVTRGIWTEVFGLPEDAPRRFGYYNVSTFGEIVDRADQKKMSFDEGWRHGTRDQPAAQHRSGCLSAIWVLFVGIVGYGLIITALFSPEARPEWSHAFAGLSFGGSTESLVFFCMFLFLSCIGRTVKKWLRLRIVESGPPWLEKLNRAFRWVVRITLPIAVVLVWTSG